MSKASKDQSTNLRMYILVKDSLSPGWAAVSAAHAAVKCVFKYIDNPDFINWSNHSFRKVVCVVTDEEFENAKKVPNNVVMVEDSLKNKETAIAFCPREEWPTNFVCFKLYK